ncbi:MAG: adenylyl-sulfate kinase [Salibacteraceae bacterium]
MKDNPTNNPYYITTEQRQMRNQHRSLVIWFTGLSGAGKTTLANAVEIKLFNQGVNTAILDGDNVRNGLNQGLSFSPEDRRENIRRVAEVSKLMIDSGLVVLAAFISPTAKSRNEVESIVGKNNFLEIYVSTSLEVCEKRDVKGLYKKARTGEIKNMTGISAPYEQPLGADLIINTEGETVETSAKTILDFIASRLPLTNE